MSNQTYNLRWEEAMAELHEQVHLEMPPVPEGEKVMPVQEDGFMAFQHYGSLYVKYMQIFKKLEECYDCMVHPQKRIDIMRILKITMCRVVELKHRLVKWNPPNIDVRQSEEPFPWEYVNLDEILVDLKLPPETIEVPIPHYFVEDRYSDIRSRDKLIEGYMKLKHSREKIYVEDHHELDFEFPYSLVQAIAEIQRNERGRQGRNRALTALQRRRRSRLSTTDLGVAPETDPTTAAKSMQRLFRGFHSRKKVQRSRDSEMVFIGMKPKSNEKIKTLTAGLAKDRIKRKADQKDYKEGYAMGLVEARELLKDEIGPDLRDSMMEDRRKWFTAELAAGKFPTDLSAYYASKNAPPTTAQAPPEPKGKKKKGKKGKGKEKGGKKAKGKGKKKKGKKKKGKGEPVEPEKPPILTGDTEGVPLTQVESVKAMRTERDGYEHMWQERDERDNLRQQHDMQLCRDEVRPDVEKEIRDTVDYLLKDQLENLKTMLDKKGGKKKKGKKKKGKKRKGKKKKGKKKKGKKKKGKKLAGEKFCSHMDLDQMLSLLIDNQIVNHYKPHKMEDFIGEFNYLGSSYNENPDNKENDKWIPQDPSEPQLRQSLTEYAILPLGESDVKEHLSKMADKDKADVRSILLYGPKNSGKTMLVQAICNHTGAMLINLSPENIEGKFVKGTLKNEAAKLIHMCFYVAANKTMSPVVIYFDEVEKIFKKGKKKSTGPERIKQVLMDYKKRYLTKTDRVIIIGNCNRPQDIAGGDMKDVRNFFDKYLYVPWPQYSSLCRLWSTLIEKALDGANVPDDFDISTLARVSQGYTAGAIAYAVKNVLTPRRVKMMALRPLEESEFLNPLSQCPNDYAAQHKEFREFTRDITGLEKKRKELLDGLKGDEKGKKKKGKKKKKKK